MQVFSFQTDHISPSTALSCALRAVVGSDAVSLWAGDKHGRTLALKSWVFAGGLRDFDAVESDLRHIFGSEELLSLPFHSKSLALSSPPATLVPRRLFVGEHLEQYFKLLLRDAEKRVYGHTHLDEHDCFLVWAAEPGLDKLCRQYFKSNEMGHIAAHMLRNWSENAAHDGFSVFANVRGHKVQIGVFEQRNLVFFNVFDYQKPADLLYYVLLAYKQSELLPLQTPLMLSGTVIEDSDLFRLLSRYIPSIRFMPLDGGLNVPEGARSVPAHYWFDLSTTCK
jgi:hypothetical protein